jgi:ABC-2 type transport system permease protein
MLGRTAGGATVALMQGAIVIAMRLILGFRPHALAQLPLFFLSGALFPLGQVPAALAFVARLNPLAYGIDGLRGSLTGAWHFGAVLDVGVLGVLTLLLLLVASRLFDRIEA